VIAAAGSGTRLGAGGPKALVEVAGRPLVAWSLDAIAAAEMIGAVVIAAPVGFEDELEAVARDATVLVGASSRSGSVANALARVETEIVAVHDAARPLAPPALFDAAVEALAEDPECDGVISAAPVSDTLKRASGDRLRVSETVDREGLWAIQTPQAFRTHALRGALTVDAASLEAATDDAMLVEAAGGSVRLHPVTEFNPKVTGAADLALVEALLRGRLG
jgi:2-C-methyl-D-erythritol 4-phosphate cytidylyltransferase